MKRSSLMIFTAMMTISLMTATAFAEEPVTRHERICGTEALRVAIEEGYVDYDNVSEYVSSETIKTFTEEKMMLAEEKLSDVDISEADLADGYEERIIDLGDDSYVKITLTDVEEGNDSGIEITPAASTAPSTTLWKDYGNRKFTSKYEISILGTKYILSLCNHYTLSQSGVVVRYGESSIYKNSIPLYEKGKVSIVKKSAGVGNSVVVNCMYDVTTGKTYKMNNSVKCVQIDKTNKRVKVTQSWSGNWM